MTKNEFVNLKDGQVIKVKSCLGMINDFFIIDTSDIFIGEEKCSIGFYQTAYSNISLATVEEIIAYKSNLIENIEERYKKIIEKARENN